MNYSIDLNTVIKNKITILAITHVNKMTQIVRYVVAIVAI